MDWLEQANGSWQFFSLRFEIYFCFNPTERSKFKNGITVIGFFKFSFLAVVFYGKQVSSFHTVNFCSDVSDTF